jgi:sulfur-oxidizing protein SoxY
MSQEETMRRTAFARAALLGVLIALAPQATWAGSAWDGTRAELFGDRPIAAAEDRVVFEAPYRAMDQRTVAISAAARFADGRRVKSVTFVVDENPMPVAAVFRFGDARERVELAIDVRLNEPSGVRVIVEASDGALYMAEKFVKASGLGVCAAPPIGDQQAAAKTMGRMRLADLTGSDEAAATTRYRRRVQLDIQHPQNTGLQMNQVTMLYIPQRFISAIEVRQGDHTIFTMEGSMTLSENPRVAFDYQVNGASPIRVLVRDTGNAAWEQEFPVGSGS